MTQNETTHLTVLLVEDFEDARHFMRMELERHGYRVIEADDGKRAVELALSERPDIILMDLSLRGIDGFAATEEIRKHEEMRNVPIVAVTAHQEADLRMGAKTSGFNAYLTKPVDMDWLSELIPTLIS